MNSRRDAGSRLRYWFFIFDSFLSELDWERSVWLLDEAELAGIDESPDHAGITCVSFGGHPLGDVLLTKRRLTVEQAEEDDLRLLRRGLHLLHGAEDERVLVGEHLLRLAIHHHQHLGHRTFAGAAINERAFGLAE